MKIANHVISGLRWSMPSWLVFIMAGTLLGCAGSPPPPTESIAVAQAAIERAERARVSEYAAAELTQARELLSRAKSAMAQEEMERAEHFAQQSEATTQLALARAELREAQSVNAEMTKSISQLEQEIQRNRRENL